MSAGAVNTLILTLTCLGVFSSGPMVAENKHSAGTKQQVRQEKMERQQEKLRERQEKFEDKPGQHGPPDHAPAHGYRRKFQYYPQANVYYDEEREVYNYYDEDRGEWLESETLPESLGDLVEDSASVILETDDNPYEKNEEHRQEYGRDSW